MVIPMTKIEKILLPLTGGAGVVLCVLWINAQQANMKLTRDLQVKESELSQTVAEKKGLLQANDQLLSRLRTVEQAAAALKNAPRPIVEQTEEETAMETLVMDPAPPMDSGVEEDSQEPTILTPEQLAEKKQREEERAAQQAEREQRRKEFQERVVADIQNRREFFGQINTEGLAPEYQEAHQKLIQSLNTVEGLMSQISDPELSRDERREIGRELWGQSREIQGLMDMQRDVLLNDYAELSLGLTPDQTREFMEYMETVNQMTSGSPMRGSGGRGRGGR